MNTAIIPFATTENPLHISVAHVLLNFNKVLSWKTTPVTTPEPYLVQSHYAFLLSFILKNYPSYRG